MNVDHSSVEFVRLSLGIHRRASLVLVLLIGIFIPCSGQTADDYFKRGNDHLNKNEYEKAVANYTEALRLDSRHASAYLNRAVAHLKLNDFDKAINDCTQAIKINPKSAEAYHQRGTAYGRTGRFDEAVVDLDRALHLNPRLAAAYFSRGVINNALGNNQLAIEDYTQALKLQPQMGEAYYNRAASYMRYKQYDRAIADYTRTISLKPDDAAPFWARGSAYAEKKKYDQAIEDLTKAISLAPTETRYYHRRAEIYCAQKKQELAAADKQRIIELGGMVEEGCDAAEVPQSQLQTKSSRRRFEDYSEIQKFTGKPATPVITTARAHQYRTVIRKKSESGPNFAGHYTITSWGCGSTCIGFAIVDARTGSVHFHPKALQVMQVPYQAEPVLQFRPDSRVLIISGEILPLDPNSSSGPENTGKFYYEWKNNRFRLLETVSILREEGAPQLSSDVSEADEEEPQTRLDDLCAGLDNSYECAKAIEQHQLQKTEHGGRVMRAGGQLRLKLGNGRWHTIRDYQRANDEASTIKYSFRDYLTDIGYFLIHRQFYEGIDYLMIDERNGRRFVLQELPVVSPDRRRLVTASNGIIGGYSPNAVQIWRVTKSGLVLEQTIRMRDWGPSDARWIDNQTIDLTKTFPTVDESGMRTERVKLILSGRWQIRN